MGLELRGEKTLTEYISKEWSLIFILFLAILGTYYESLSYPFFNLDDPFFINENPYIRDLTLKGIWKIFSKPIGDNYFPLQFLSYAFDYQIWHIQSFGYHLHNVILHFLNAALVFLLLKKIFSNTWVSFLTALLFALHPVNVESVTWVAERKNVLSLALMLSSFLAYLHYVGEQGPTRRRRFYMITFFLFLLALLAKVSAVVIPFLFILYDLCFQKRTKWQMLRDKIPFFFLALLFSALTVWIYHNGKYLADYHGGSPYTTFLAMINVFVEYIIFLIVPIYLDHLYWTPIPQTIFERQVLLSIAAIFLLVLLAWRSFRRDRVFFFGLGWFFVSLLPVLNIVPITILRADRYMYLPAIGFFYLVSRGLWKITQGEFRPYRIPVLFFCSLLVAGTYAFMTLERNRLWRDPILVWEESLEKFPQSVTPYRYIGSIYADRGENNLAISYFRAGLRENPKDVILLNGLALAYKNKKDLKKAEELLIEARRLNPHDSGTWNNLGTIYLEKGEIEEARFYLERALEINPQHAPAHVNLGINLCSLNQWKEAIREFERAIELSPGSIEPYLNLSLIYEQKSLLDKAESYLKKGLDFAPESHAALSMMGRISFEQGKIQEAKFYLSQAYRINPNDGDARYFLKQIVEGQANHSFQETMKTSPPSKLQVIEAPIEKNPGLRG